MNKKTIKKFKKMFKALDKAEKLLGKEIIDEIEDQLIRGQIAIENVVFLENLRRTAAAHYFGFTRDEYEKMLENPKYVPKRKIEKRPIEIVKEFLCLNE